MQKPLALSIALCLGLTGCQVFERSETWETTLRVRPGETARDPDPSQAYASKLHRVLADRGVEHKVVVYQYRYTTRLREEAVGTRTAVIYRDETTPSHAWWLKDDRLHRAVWLPNGSLDRQVSFYLRRKAQVIEESRYPSGSGSGKNVVAFARSEPRLRSQEPVRQSAIVSSKPSAPKPPVLIAKKAAAEKKEAPVGKPVVVRSSSQPVPVTRQLPVESAKKMVAANSTPKPQTVQRTALRGPIERAFAAKQKARQAAPETTEKLAPVAPRGSTPWAPPMVLDPEQQLAVTAPRDRFTEKMFHKKHGTEYNPFSATDRRKMAQLQKGVAVHRE